MDRELINFWIGIASLSLSVIAFIVGTIISIFIFIKNRRNYIYIVKKKLNKLERYIDSIEKHHLKKYKKSFSKNQELSDLSVFRKVESLILKEINDYISSLNLNGFIDWKSNNSIQNIIKYNKDGVKNLNNQLKKLRLFVSKSKLIFSNYGIIFTYEEDEESYFDLFGKSLYKETELKENSKLYSKILKNNEFDNETPDLEDSVCEYWLNKIKIDDFCNFNLFSIEFFNLNAGNDEYYILNKETDVEYNKFLKKRYILKRGIIIYTNLFFCIMELFLLLALQKTLGTPTLNYFIFAIFCLFIIINFFIWVYGIIFMVIKVTKELKKLIKKNKTST